jgi:Xaa-Pro aminopeptidase
VLLLTGYWPVIGASIAICFRDGPTKLLVPEDEQEIAEAGFANSIETFTADTLYDMRSITEAVKPVLTATLQHSNLDHGSVGIESEGSSQPASYVAMHLFGNNLADIVRETAPNAKLVPSDACIRNLKSVKSRWEIEKIRDACGIARKSFEQAAPQLRSGMDEPEAAELFRVSLQGTRAARRNFLRCDGFAFCMSGPNAAKASGAYARTRNRTLEQNDTVMIHCNSYVDGFWTDITRTYALDSLDKRQTEMRTAVLAGRSAALECIKPGVRAADVDAASRRAITGFGLGEYLRHGTGHGVGFSPISAYSIPRLHMKSSDVLQEGTVFNVEPAVYVDGYGGIRHCDMVAVTATGYELLTDFQTDAASLTSSHLAGTIMQLAEPNTKS